MCSSDLDPNGGFYSTLDADSEGVEGKFYVWQLDEFRNAAGADADELARYFDVSAHGNWEHQNILNVPRHTEDPALLEKIASLRSRLFEIRKQRIHPGRDEKILTDWNGLMLRAFAEAAAFLNHPGYRKVAEENAEFLLSTLWDGKRLLHSYKDGRARFNGYLDDYVNVADGLLALYQLTFDRRWLDKSIELADLIHARFADPVQGGFFFTATDHEQLISRTKDQFDNATPSGNSVAADLLLDRKSTRLNSSH